MLLLHILSLALLGPAVAHGQSSQRAAAAGCRELDAVASAGRAVPRTVADTIRALEALVRARSEPFPAALHNELRHQYGAVDESVSMCHADAILAHAPMDAYIVDILSGWQRDRDRALAVVNLLGRAEEHPRLLHLRAASLIAAADLLRADGRRGDATRLYARVRTLAREPARAAPALRRYARLAELRMTA